MYNTIPLPPSPFKLFHYTVQKISDQKTHKNHNKLLIYTIFVVLKGSFVRNKEVLKAQKTSKINFWKKLSILYWLITITTKTTPHNNNEKYPYLHTVNTFQF